MLNLPHIRHTDTDNFFLIAGTCVVENEDITYKTAHKLQQITNRLGIPFIFKASYRKANRTRLDSYTGPGDEMALQILRKVGDQLHLPLLTDIHESDEAAIAAEYVDVLQIPAFLCRQTDLLVAAAKTGKIVNVKKGQFLSPEAMKFAVNKIKESGNDRIWLTERGTFFGYHNLVVDFRSLIIMKEFGYPVIYDATHSVQLPSQGEVSSGQPQFIIPLAKAAAAVGIDGLFFETHPEPERAKSDAASQLPLNKAEEMIKQVMKIVELV